MPNLLGIIVPLRNFLANSEEQVWMFFEGEKKSVLSLKKGREYTIPDFQREIRWNKDNVAILIEDIASGPKFLGNVILTKHSDLHYSIIDGQQRITSLTMILKAIDMMHNEEIDTIKPCMLNIDSFSLFSAVLDADFSEEIMESSKVLESDRLRQLQKYNLLWKYIKGLEDIVDKRRARKLMENLKASSLNLIINESSDVGDGIRYFIDVNLKGKQLDTEDIFKSYLFRNDSSSEIRERWYELKWKVADIEKSKMEYPLLKLLEHFFYCDLYLNDEFRGVEFGNDFLIKKSHKMSSHGGKVTVREGTHLIELISDNGYMRKALQKINGVVTIMLGIVNSSSITVEFENIFLCTNDSGNIQKLDSVELSIIHNILGKILKDSKMPTKALVMKYLLLLQKRQKNKTKKHIREIYGIYMFTVLFSIFENKKSTEVLLSILKADDDSWYSELVHQIKSYFSTEKITNARLLAQYRLSQNEEEEDYRFRCKSLATIYNFFSIDDKDVVVVRKGKTKDLHRFISNNEVFSTEHFIISETKRRSMQGDKVFDEYILDEKIYSSYVNNFFNFIFIDDKLNGILSNYWLPHKIDLVKSEKIECEYSKMVISKLDNLTNEFTKRAGEDYKDKLDLFFARDFKDLYVEYTRDVLNAVIEHIKKR